MSNAYAISMLPERFNHQPRTQTLEEYISRKYSKYGYRKSKGIKYNPESKENKFRWVENVSNGLRFVGDAHKIIRLNHTGWYADNFQDEVIRGQVFQLPAHKGELRYVPGVNDPDNDDAAAIDFSSVTNDKEDAARWADQMAARWAEEQREYQAKEDVENRIREIEDEIRAKYKEFRRISREIHANCDTLRKIAVVRELVKEKWENTKEEIHRLRAEMRRIEQNGIEY